MFLVLACALCVACLRVARACFLAPVDGWVGRLDFFVAPHICSGSLNVNSDSDIQIRIRDIIVDEIMILWIFSGLWMDF